MLKNVMLPALFSAVSPRFLQSMMRIPLILPYYHIVSDEDVPLVKHLYRFRNVAQFLDDIDFMLQHFTPITLLDLIAYLKGVRSLPDHALLLTFDDGFRQIHDIVAPILRAKGMPATFFLTTAFLDNKALCHHEKCSLLVENLRAKVSNSVVAALHKSLDENGIKPGDVEGRILSITYSQRHIIDLIAADIGCDFAAYLKTAKPYLTAEQVRSLKNEGFTVGAHSIDHPHFAMLSLAEQLRQTIVSIREIRSRFTLDYSAFAFPHSELGVPKEFFRTIYDGGGVDVTFGTRGLLADEEPFNLQRFTMEKTQAPANRILARQFARRCAKRICRQAVIRRDQRPSSGFQD